MKEKGFKQIWAKNAVSDLGPFSPLPLRLRWPRCGSIDLCRGSEGEDASRGAEAAEPPPRFANLQPTQVRNVSPPSPCPECEPSLQVHGPDSQSEPLVWGQLRYFGRGYRAANMLTEDALVAGGACQDMGLEPVSFVLNQVWTSGLSVKSKTLEKWMLRKLLVVLICLYMSYGTLSRSTDGGSVKHTQKLWNEHYIHSFITFP